MLGTYKYDYGEIFIEVVGIIVGVIIIIRKRNKITSYRESFGMIIAGGVIIVNCAYGCMFCN